LIYLCEAHATHSAPSILSDFSVMLEATHNVRCVRSQMYMTYFGIFTHTDDILTI